MTIAKAVLAAAAAATLSTAAAAQDSRAGKPDPVAQKHLDSRQYRGEPKANAGMRDTRCRIVKRRGQDRRVCGQPGGSGNRR